MARFNLRLFFFFLFFSFLLKIGNISGVKSVWKKYNLSQKKKISAFIFNHHTIFDYFFFFFVNCHINAAAKMISNQKLFCKQVKISIIYIQELPKKKKQN